VNDVYTFCEGRTPLLISIPHDGRRVPGDILERMTPAACDLPDTDWHVERLYGFAAALGASILVAQYSRYVVDLNRPADDGALYPGQVATGLCPEQTFGGDELYSPGLGLAGAEKSRRIDDYWRPYHDKLGETLAALKREHGYALLWDAHSIPSEVPRLFDGRLPVLNVGTFDGRSCDETLAGKVFEVAASSPYAAVLNGRFKGGYITRHYGTPATNVHAIQLEIAQRAYMDEASRDYDEVRATALRETLQSMLEAFLAHAVTLRR
jgi:N-formylglutamate amidohydrolase